MMFLISDKKLNARLKGKVYKTAVHPAMMYGSKCGDKEGTRKDDCCRDEDVVLDVCSQKER